MNLVLRLTAAAAALAGAAMAALLAFALSAPAIEPSGLFQHRALSLSCEAEACALSEFEPLAARAPLDHRAFGARMEAAVGAGDMGAARIFAAHVLERDKRAILARYILATEAMEAGDPDRYLAVFLPLFQIDGRWDSVSLFAGILSGFSLNPDYFQRIERHILTTRPGWGEAYLRALAAEPGIPVERKRALFAEYPGAQPALLSGLIRAGDWSAAYRLFTFWIGSGALAGEEPAPQRAVPFNPGLVRSAAPAPFNWQLHSGGAEYLTGGGVYIFFEGRRAETFLSQTFPLGPGAWRLSLRMSGEVRPSGGSLRWRLTCADGAGTPDLFDIAGLGAAPSVAVFDVPRPPEACPFVTLSLEGVPGMFPQPARLELTEIRIEPAGVAGEGG